MATCFDQHDDVIARRALRHSRQLQPTIPAGTPGEITYLQANSAYVKFEGFPTAIVNFSDLSFVSEGRPAEVFDGTINGGDNAA